MTKRDNRLRGGGRWRRIATVAILVTVVVGVAARPTESQAEDVEAIIKRGVELRRQGQDRQALAEFQRALAIQKQPRIVSQIGLAEQALGDWLSAATHLEAALASADDPWIKKNHAILEQALQTVETHLGRVDVWGEPAGADVLLDGVSVGKLPLPHPVRVTESQVTLTVRAPGYGEIVRVLRIPLGELVRERVELRASVPEAKPIAAVGGGAGVAATPGGATTTATAVKPQPSLIAQPSPGGGKTPEAPDASTSIVHRWWFWSLVGAVVGGAGAGAYLLSRNTPPACNPPTCSTWSN